MALKGSYGKDLVRTAAHADQFNSASGSSRPAPEDGVRLMRSFLSIRQRAVREAIIVLATKLSAAEAQDRSRFADNPQSRPLP